MELIGFQKYLSKDDNKSMQKCSKKLNIQQILKIYIFKNFKINISIKCMKCNFFLNTFIWIICFIKYLKKNQTGPNKKNKIFIFD